MAAGAVVYLEGTSCVQICPDGKYGAEGNNTCTSCAAGCATCSGATSNECYTCTSVASDKYYKIIGEDTCSLTCPTGQFIDSNIDFICQSCSSECVGC